MNSDAERIQVIESILAGYRRSSVDEMVEHVTVDVEWRPLVTADDGRVFRGPEGVRQWYRDLRDSFDEVTALVDEHNPVGERLLTRGRLRASGRASGATIDQAVTWLWDFRGGAVRRMEVFGNHGEAVAAARGRAAGA